MRVIAVIQARVSSSRLPGKVLLPLSGEPLLARMLERVRRSHELDGFLVATTTDPQDDAIVALCQRIGVPHHRGHPTDCLQRHVHALQALDAAEGRHADAVVKLPSDCPMLDPAVIDRVVSVFRREADHVDYASNLHPGSWPDGNDVEVMHRAVLEEAAELARDSFDREHTTPFIWSRPDRYRLRNVAWQRGWDLSRSQRWVVDWPADYQLVSACYEALYPLHGAGFGVDDVLGFLAQHPELAGCNAVHRSYDYRLTREQTAATTVTEHSLAGAREGRP